MTIQAYCVDVLAGRSESLQAAGFNVDGTELEVEVKATVLDLEGKQDQLNAIRDVTERQRKARRAAAQIDAFRATCGIVVHLAASAEPALPPSSQAGTAGGLQPPVSIHRHIFPSRLVIWM